MPIPEWIYRSRRRTNSVWEGVVMGGGMYSSGVPIVNSLLWTCCEPAVNLLCNLCLNYLQNHSVDLRMGIRRSTLWPRRLWEPVAWQAALWKGCSNRRLLPYHLKRATDWLPVFRSYPYHLSLITDKTLSPCYHGKQNIPVLVGIAIRYCYALDVMSEWWNSNKWYQILMES